MLFELSMYPLGQIHMSDALGTVLRTVAESGLPYKVTPTGTCIEGEWDQVMGVIRKCHSELRMQSPHVITNISIEDEEGATNKLERNIESVERTAGMALQH